MNIVEARRVEYFSVPKPTSAWTRAGIRYETSVRRALSHSSHCLVVHTPQFAFAAECGTAGHCIPDFILAGLDFIPPDSVVVLECKLTYKPEAAEKLIELYCPVLRRALKTELVWPVVVVKNLTREAPVPHFTLKTAILGRLTAENEPCCPPTTALSVPIVQWLGRGDFPIGGSSATNSS